MVREWWVAHDRMAPPPLEILPRLGIVIEPDGEPVCAAWLYMDNSVGVCFVEFPVTKPGLSLTEMRLAFAVGVQFLKLEAAALGYGVMMVRTLPGLARVLASMGFRRGGEGLVCMETLTTA